MVEKDVKQILKGLKEKARKGSSNDIKLLVDLAGLTEQKPAANPDDESRMLALRDLASQPEHQEPAEGGGNGDNPQSGDLQTAPSAAAEKPTENLNDIP